jgi:hypothetical protein
MGPGLEYEPNDLTPSAESDLALLEEVLTKKALKQR